MRVAYFDCFNGASGDMIVGALLDAGATIENLQSRLATLPIAGYDVGAEKIVKQGFAATRFRVRYSEDQPHRHLKDVVSLIRSGELSERVCAQSCQIFEKLADAEARVHGTTPQKVHFHEVGAIDAIADIVGACLALEELDVDRVLCSALPTGSGTVVCQHGTMPVPAPATAILLAHLPLASSDESGELTTPTGAAILATLGESFGTLPGMILHSSGYGAGTREGQNRPNVLRVMIGDLSAEETDEIVLLQANIDDQSPEILAYAIEKLLAAGALDAYTQPIYMKKGRCGMLLTVLCTPHRMLDLERIIFAETTTFGVRHQRMQRSKLQRRFETVNLDGATIRIKIGAHEGHDISAMPEFEDCRKLAEQSGRPLKGIISQAIRLWQEHASG